MKTDTSLDYVGLKLQCRECGRTVDVPVKDRTQGFNWRVCCGRAMHEVNPSPADIIHDVPTSDVGNEIL